MVADEVSSGSCGADDLRALADEAADHEERGAGVVAGEDFGQALGGDVVGAVVVGEGDLAGIVAGDDDRAEELRLRSQRGVGTSPGSEEKTCSGCGLGEGVRHSRASILRGSGLAGSSTPRVDAVATVFY